MTTPITVSQTCAICLKAPSNPLETACCHIFCRDCLTLSQVFQAEDSCTLCRRVTQMPFPFLLDEDVNTMVREHTDLQTRIKDLNEDLEAKIQDLGAQPQETPSEETVGKRLLTMALCINFRLSILRLEQLKNRNDQIHSNIEDLQRTSQQLSSFYSTRQTPPTVNLAQQQEQLLLTFSITSLRQVTSLMMIQRGKLISIQQKQLQNDIMQVQTHFKTNTELQEFI